MITIHELRQKEVINVKDGCRYGYVADIEFCEQKGHVKKLIVPGQAKIFGMFGRDDEFFIPWSCIRKIGSDIILVELDSKSRDGVDDEVDDA